MNALCQFNHEAEFECLNPDQMEHYQTRMNENPGGLEESLALMFCSNCLRLQHVLATLALRFKPT